MKATMTPPVEREVTITMSAKDASVLIDVVYNLTWDRNDGTALTATNLKDRQASARVSGDMHRALYDAGVRR